MTTVNTLIVSKEAQAYKDGVIADCETRTITRYDSEACPMRATMVVEDGPETYRVQLAHCHRHGHWALTMTDTAEIVIAR